MFVLVQMLKSLNCSVAYCILCWMVDVCTGSSPSFADLEQVTFSVYHMTNSSFIITTKFAT
jgi:hypothetical protein